MCVMMVQPRRFPNRFARLQWGNHCGRKIFLECARRRGFLPRIEVNQQLRQLVLTCYHCGQEFRVTEQELEAGPVTYAEVNANFRGARYV
jgi:transcription elongation factor Elf1